MESNQLYEESKKKEQVKLEQKRESIFKKTRAENKTYTLSSPFYTFL
jgi:hypothetical protein